MPVNDIEAFIPNSGKRNQWWINANLSANLPIPQAGFEFFLDGKKALAPYSDGIVGAGDWKLVPAVGTQEELTVTINLNASSFSAHRPDKYLVNKDYWCVFSFGRVPFMHVIGNFLLNTARPKGGSQEQMSATIEGHCNFLAYWFGNIAQGWDTGGVLTPPANFNGSVLTWAAGSIVVDATGVLVQKS